MKGFKISNKAAILTASGLTFFGNGMHFIAMSWLVLEMTNNPFYVSLLVIIGIIPGIISSPFAGAVADRYNRKVIAISMDVFRMLIVLSIPLTSIYIGEQLWILYIATILLTLGSNFFFPAISSIIKTSFPKEEYIKVLSANSTLIQIGMIGGSGIAGFIIANFSINVVFYLDALTFFLSTVFLLFIKYNPIQVKNGNLKEKQQSLFKDIALGFNYVFTNKTIVLFFLIGVIPNAVTHIINSLLSSYTKDVLNLGVSEYGILDASFAVGFVIVGSILSIKKKVFSESVLLRIGFLLMSFSMICLYIGGSFILGIIALASTGMSIVLAGPSIKSLLMREVSDEYVGRVESFNWMVFSSISPILAVVMTILASQTSLQTAFFVLSILILAMFIVCQLYFKQVNKKITLDQPD